MTTGAGSMVPSGAAASGVGRWLGRYELLHEIATGGMATVYLGRARGAAGFERVVAIKCCHPHLRHDEDFATMFLDEARLAARIHHPNVVGTLDVGDDEALYLVMEYIEGDRLSGLIKAAGKRGQRLPVGIACRTMIEILSGLHAAHELNDAQGKPLHIVHRDVSPQNILVGVDGVSRITDFGIAKAEARATVTREGQVKGKMSYMAPEQLSSHGVTRRADIYAAGVVLWEALTARRLFRAETDAETLNMVLHGVVPKPSSVNPDVAPEIDAIVGKALEREPERRYETAADFAEALEAAPIKLATTRTVSAYINEVLAEPIAKRRELLRRLDEGASLPPPERADPNGGSHSLVRMATGSTTTTGGTRRGAAQVPAGAEGPVITEVPEPVAPPAPASRRWVYYGALAVVAVAAALGTAFALRGPGEAPPAVRPALRLRHPVAVVPAPGASPLPVAPAATQEVAPSGTAQGTQGAGSPEPPRGVEAPVAPGPAAQASEARGNEGSPVVVRRRGGGRPARGPTTGTQPSSGTTHAVTPTTEFRPGSI